ncbi:DUF1330 domain-containing protein [Streptomyces sp. NPDC059851]|uniref:DUF1330 domain-containing protein n=1 Tax=Streptomyces sp. NPDC059851 TaxID=3346971 RepID=UPI00365A7AF7
MTAYAIGHIRPETMNEDILRYIETIQATMDPFGGRFLVHGGGPVEVLEGSFTSSLVIIAFPDMERARAWYASEAYQEILPLRTRHIEGDVFLAEGVPPTYDATRTAARIRKEAGL